MVVAVWIENQHVVPFRRDTNPHRQPIQLGQHQGDVEISVAFDGAFDTVGQTRVGGESKLAERRPVPDGRHLLTACSRSRTRGR